MACIRSSEGRSGVEVTYDWKRREIRLFGWYDTFVGIEPKTMSLKGFLKGLKIPLTHISPLYGRKKK